jgi:hypothetical protein
MDSAQDRDSVMLPLLHFIQRFFEFTGLFVVHQDHVMGWRGATLAMTEKFSNVHMALDTPSVLQVVYHARGPYLGPIPNSTSNAMLLHALEREFPRVALLVPLVVGDKIAGILYADNGSQVVSLSRVAAVLAAIQRAGVSLATFILRSKARAGWGSVEISQDEKYIAFQDVKDERSLGDWEDVLFDTLESSKPSSTSAKADAPQVGWEDVIREALADEPGKD